MGATASGPAMKGTGLLLTHDWTQLYTEQGLQDTTKTVLVNNTNKYHTVTFPITSVSQYEACINNKIVCDARSVKGCPIELGNGSCKSCPVRPLSAIVKVTYKVTDSVSGNTQGVLGKNVVTDLKKIMEKMLQNNQVEGDISAFLRKYGSHFQLGVQKLGKAFVRMVVVYERCDTKLLTEIAKEIFAICDEHFVATQEGSWYSPKHFLSTSNWSPEKKQILTNAKLRISQFGTTAKSASLVEWKSNTCNQPQNLSGIDSTNIVSAWDLIKKSKFKSHKKLSSELKEGWKRLILTTKHKDIVITHNSQATGTVDVHHPWSAFVQELGMAPYFPCTLSPENVRCLQHLQKICEKKDELVWRMLEQLMLTNTRCREQDISNYAKAVKQEDKPKQFGQSTTKTMLKSTQLPEAPHPMDVLLLLFMCSDFILRQILARKLFMCRLAIPFMIPANAEEKIEMLMWPLRSIVMEWVNKEEALVKCKLNMVTFMRCGKTKLSKSELLNKLLSVSGHPAFFHRGLPCGHKKRLISNGTVEMSHFLPGGSQQDQFKEPALFFNLRGDACDHPVQHQVLMDLPTTVLMIIDIGELEDQRVQERFKDTLSRKKQNLVIVLTDSNEHDEENLERLQELFCEIVGNKIDTRESVVTTFEMNGGQKNVAEVNDEIKDAIARKMTKEYRHSMENLTTTTLSQCVVDEERNRYCRTGKDVAEDLLATLKELDPCTRKEKLLPLQGDCLNDIGKLLRQLHRSSSKDTSIGVKEGIKQRLKDIRREQSASRDHVFVLKVIALFHQDESIKAFAILWVQLELDAISRSILPQLQSAKNRKWNELTKARSEEDKPRIAEFEHQLQQAEKKLSGASCGWEHLMREVGQLYEVSIELKMMGKVGSMFNLSTLPKIMGSQLLDGHPVELMDGDHGFIPIEWIKAVFHSLAQLAGQDKKIFVLSVMGIQSSGKSTLLNTMFGLEFAVSAGRCTRGIYAQLLHVPDTLPFDYILVLDSEGLKSQELENQNFEHDNELATLVIGLADLALINLKGENARDITDVLQIVVHAFLRMKLADSSHRRQCMFIHQNVSAINAAVKLTGDRQKLLEELNRMTKEASITQGLNSEIISSFNQIISFDCHRDVVYFSDLWTGNPPMGTVNPDYSMRAADTRQSMLEQIPHNFKGFITITDFISRVDDMWNGVLADDFIFSFRSTLAAKAYIEVERECGRLMQLVEEELWQWVNTGCKLQMENTKSEDEMHQCYQELGNCLKEKVASFITKNVLLLEEFFGKHSASEIIVQWKSEKLASFKVFCHKQENQREEDLERMKLRNLFRIRQGNSAQVHEQELINKAIAVAEKMRGKCQPNEVQEQFDNMWAKWKAHLVKDSPQTPINALSELKAILYCPLYADILMYLQKEFDSKPPVNAQTVEITPRDFSKEHIALKEKVRQQENLKAMVRPQSAKRFFSKISQKVIEAALHKANIIFQRVMEQVNYICCQDIMFDQLQGRQILKHLFEEIDKHNAGSSAEVHYVFTHQFKAMMAVRVAYCAAPKFDHMSQRFEAKYGIAAQMKEYKQRVFLRFKNTVEDTNAEMAAAQDFCEALKGKVQEYTKIDVEINVLRELYAAIGNTKYDLIIQMLDAFVKRENNNDTEKKRNFADMRKYLTKPVKYATSWLKDFGSNQIFYHDNGQSKYSMLAEHCIDKIFTKIVSSTSEATSTVDNVAKAQQYSAWITEFCANIKDAIPLDPDQLRVTTSISSIRNFQKYVEDGLAGLQDDIKTAFSQVNEETVTWLERESPYVKVVTRLWGCTVLCPFCLEPCQDSDPNHTSSHRCVQHRPPGICGTRIIRTKVLTTTTCNLDITLNATFKCSACHYHCRNTEHCNAIDKNDDDPFHPYKEYKKFLPGWDIAPDPADTASSYWQWAMCTYQKQILEEYEGTKLEIPESWYEATEHDAIDSLRFFTT